MGVENIVKEATELLDIGDLSSSTFSWSSSSSLELQLDRSAYNGVCQQVLELKILLLQLRRLLDWVRLLFIAFIKRCDRDTTIIIIVSGCLHFI